MSANARLDSPSYHENITPILGVLRDALADVSGHVLEVGSGTGQHVVDFARAFPGITWWPTDVDPHHLSSIAAWRERASLPNLQAPVRLDAGQADWGLGQSDRPPADGFAAMVCINVTHISPWATAEGLMRGAGQYLTPGGLLYLYGPYSRDRTHTAPSNQRFDQYLRAQNPDWGVRDIADIETLGREHGLSLQSVIDMPVNNFSIILERVPDGES
jgi:SAM-dependent methyltransferase